MIYLVVIYIRELSSWNIPYLLDLSGVVLLLPDLSFDITTFNRVIVIFWLAPAGLIVMFFFADRLRPLSPAARRSVARS